MSAGAAASRLVTYVDVVKIPPPPIPASCARVRQLSIASSQGRRPTNRATISVSIFVDSPQARVPIAQARTAVWFAPRRPRALHSRPYSGVKVHVASRYLEENAINGTGQQASVEAHEVPSQLA